MSDERDLHERLAHLSAIAANECEHGHRSRHARTALQRLVASRLRAVRSRMRK